MTLMNHIDIGNIVRECKHQNATYPMEIAGMAAAYAMVKNSANYWRWEPQGWDGDVEWVCLLANLIEPKTQGKFRSGPVTFWNEEDPGTWEPVNDSLVPGLIPRAMESLFDAIFDQRITADEFYQEFETIHPFFDCNGRLGNILWRYFKAQEIGDQAWELENPPPFISKKKDK